MKQKLLILLALAAVAGVVAMVVINQKSKQINQRNQAAATAAPAAPTNAPAAVKAAVPAPENLADFKSKPGSKVRMEGTSTIHDWYADGSIISGLLKIDKAALAQPKPGPVYAVVKTMIPISSLKSSSGAPMDAVMFGPKGFDTEKGSEYQRIVYNLETLEIKKAPANPGDPLECVSQGNLVIHGVTNKVELPITITKDDAGGLLIKGRVKLKMSSFGIPPVTVKVVVEIVTGDEVDVMFEWKLVPNVK
jgi:hypothetical protein